MNADTSGTQHRKGFGLSIKARVALVLLSTNLIAILATGLLYFSHHQRQLLETIEKHLYSVARQET